MTASNTVTVDEALINILKSKHEIAPRFFRPKDAKRYNLVLAAVGGTVDLGGIFKDAADVTAWIKWSNGKGGQRFAVQPATLVAGDYNVIPHTITVPGAVLFENEDKVIRHNISAANAIIPEDTDDKPLTISNPTEANAMHEHIIGSLRRTAKEMCAMGEYLCGVRSTKKRGEWGAWREKNITASERACQEYMAFYKRSQRNNSFELLETSRLLSPLPVRKAANPAAATVPPPIPDGVDESVVNDLLSTGSFTREQAIAVARRAEPRNEPDEPVSNEPVPDFRNISPADLTDEQRAELEAKIKASFDAWLKGWEPHSDFALACAGDATLERGAFITADNETPKTDESITPDATRRILIPADRTAPYPWKDQTGDLEYMYAVLTSYHEESPFLCQGKDQRRYQRVIEAKDINDMTFEDGLFKNKEALHKFINWVVRQQWKALGMFENWF
jgi:hypothetical protein